MDSIDIMCITIAWIGGGFISGVTSMGASLVALPIMTMAISPERAILISCAGNFMVGCSVFLLHHRGIIIKELVYMILSSVPGSLAGILFLAYVSMPWLNIILGITLVIFVAWQWYSKGVGYRIQRYNIASQVAGIAGGLFNALTGVPGAPLGIYATLRTWSKESMLSMQGAFFAAAALFTLIIQWSRNMYTPDVLADVGCAVPGLLLGVVASIPAQRYISQSRCRRLLLVMLAFAAVVFLVRGGRGLAAFIV